MAKKYGDIVLYQMGKVTVNALVVQSNPQPDGEHLVVLYLDPAVASNSMAGSLIDKAIAKAFPAPLAGPLQYGWKDLPIGLGTAVAAKLADMKLDFSSSADLDADAAEKKTAEATAPKVTSTSSFSEAPSKVTNGL